MVNYTLLQEDGRLKECDSLKHELKLVETFPSKAYVANHVIVLVINIFVSLLTLFLNLATIVTFRSSNHLQKKLCLFLIFIQSFNDLGIGLIVSPLYSILLASELLGSTNCKVYYAFYILFLTTAVFSLIILSAMNVERYTSIVHPVYHRNKVTKKKLLVYIFSMSSLYVCVSFASYMVGVGDILGTFSGSMFLLHFVTTVCIYVKIFLVAKAQIKKSEPRVNPPKEEAQVRRNEENVIRRENDCTAPQVTLSRSLVNERTIPLKQENNLNAEDRSSNNQENILNHQAEQSYDREKNLHEEENSHHRKSMASNEGRLSHNQSSSSNDQSNHSDSQRVQSDNQDSLSDNQDNQSDNQGRRTDNGDSSSDNQCNRLENQKRQSNNQERTTGDQGSQTNSRRNQEPHFNNSDDKTSSNRKSEQEFLKKIKLAKSCMIVVICSFISFLLPAVFQPLALNSFHEVVIDGWFTVLVLLNSSLNSLIFFWRNKTLRNEAKKVLKKFRS